MNPNARRASIAKKLAQRLPTQETRNLSILNVGAGQTYTTLASAIAASADGDTIKVQAGVYINDFATINTRIALQAVGGMVELVATVPPPNGKAILVTNTDVSIDGFAFSGAVVPDGNGAGIRYQGGNLIVRNSFFHHNQDGILGAADPNGTITIEHTEFAFNGAGDGLTHSLYVGAIASLTVTDSYFHDAIVGHEIKSRALVNVISNNRIFEGATGSASYSIDLPNGGAGTISGNVIHQGPLGQNPAIVHFGGEGTPYASSSLLMSGNTILNEKVSVSARALLNQTAFVAVFDNNSVFGLTGGQIATGPANVSGTGFLSVKPVLDTSAPYSVPAICFCAGVLILTPDGEVPVERLAPGESVVTCSGEVRKIRWVGSGRVRATRLHRTAATPAIVRKGALADGVPSRDLRVTKGHAFYLDDVLIPVEFLVNHRSIVWDDHAQDISIYHIELDDHDILVANGAPAESYRDDGNRWLFQNGNPRWALPAPPPYAPVLTGGAVVDAVWRRLLDRSGPRRPAPLTDDPDLHLMVDGKAVAPSLRSGSSGGGSSGGGASYIFDLNGRPNDLRLVSRDAAPAELGLARDPRSLGVAIKRIIVRQPQHVRAVEAADPCLTEGFHAFEPEEGIRWTNGDAMLPTALFEGFRGQFELELQLGGAMRYLDIGG